MRGTLALLPSIIGAMFSACSASHDVGDAMSVDASALDAADLGPSDAWALSCPAGATHSCPGDLACAGSDGTRGGWHCAPRCTRWSDCGPGTYCNGFACVVPCTPDDLSTCASDAVCVGGGCRNAMRWATECAPAVSCTIGMGCLQEAALGIYVCETVGHANCDGACPASDICFQRNCVPRR